MQTDTFPLWIILGIFFKYWYVWLPPSLAIAFYNAWMYYKRRQAVKDLEWVLLDILPPRDVGNSPKIAESFFAGLWGVVGNPATKFDKYFKGIRPDFFCLEIVGVDGEIHFYIRTQRKFIGLIEAHIYAQYHAAEINEVPEYIHEAIPEDVPGNDWNIWGTVLRLNKEDCYPIMTYQNFVDISTPPISLGAAKDSITYSFLDPLSAVIEVLAKLKKGERIVIQVYVRPAKDDWKKKCDGLVDELTGKEKKSKKRGALAEEIVGWSGAARAVAYQTFTNEPLEIKPEDKKDSSQSSKIMSLSPGVSDIIHEIEKSISKKGFECKMQFGYIARRDVYTGATVGAIMGAFNQFSSLSLNGFRPNKIFTTNARYLFAAQRADYKKKAMANLLRERTFWEKGYILTTEELATIWHFPTLIVKSPSVPRVDSRKGEPPSGLPV